MTNSRKLQWSAMTLLVVFAISIYSCRKDNDEECCDPTNPECPNYDPCYGVEEPSAEFFIEDGVRDGFTNEFFWRSEGSGPFKGAEIRFRSPFTSAEFEHTWYIGSDVFSDQSVIVDFSEVPRPSQITVSHVLEFPIDSTCYPLSPGRDSVSISFSLINYLEELLVFGKTFRGVTEVEPDSFDVRFRALRPDGTPAAWSDLDQEVEFIRVNMHNEGDSIQLGSPRASNTFLSFGELGRFGNIEIDSLTHEVTMEYQWDDLEEYTFTGRIVE